MVDGVPRIIKPSSVRSLLDPQHPSQYICAWVDQSESESPRAASHTDPAPIPASPGRCLAPASSSIKPTPNRKNHAKIITSCTPPISRAPAKQRRSTFFSSQKKFSANRAPLDRVRVNDSPTIVQAAAPVPGQVPPNPNEIEQTRTPKRSVRLNGAGPG